MHSRFLIKVMAIVVSIVTVVSTVGVYATWTYSYTTDVPDIEYTLNLSVDEYLTQEKETVNNALGQFKVILNDSQKHETLVGLMNTTTSDTGAYVGNVVDSNTSLNQKFEALFVGEDGKNKLTLELNGKETNITAMVKKQDLDGDGAPEMTIYMTPYDPASASFPSDGTNTATQGYKPIEVYATVFTQKDGQWVQLGDMYKGIADVNNYNGWGDDNSFNTDTWLLNESKYNKFSPAVLTITNSGSSWWKRYESSYTGTDLSTVIKYYKSNVAVN